MGMDFKIEPQPGYLLMTAEGHYEPSLVGEITSRIVEACEKHQPSKMLFDFQKVDGQLSTMDRFNLSATFAIKYLTGRLKGNIPSCRFAFVGSTSTVDPKRFGETVLVNRGLNAKVFTEIKDAFAWLEVKPAEKEALESNHH
jgi:hypothetical protein